MKKKNIVKVLLSSVLITSIVSGAILLADLNKENDSSLIVNEQSEKNNSYLY